VTPEFYQRIGDIYGSGDLSAQAYADAYELGRRYGWSADFLFHNLAERLMVMCRWFASVARQPSEDEMTALISEGRALAAISEDQSSRARFQIALGFLPFWLRNGGIRTLSQQDLDDAAASVAAGLEMAEALDDARLVSAALDAMTSTEQSMNPRKARDMSRRRLAMGHRLPLDERLDALGMVAWTSALIGDLPETDRAADEAMAVVQPGQNPGFALGGASWRAYAAAMSGDWERVVATVDFLRRLWMDVERPAASYVLQGVLSGIDWARNRGEEEHLERWLGVASDIVDRFDPRHPVAALASVIRLDPAGLIGLVTHPDRYPDRQHYVEHAVALCADHAVPVPIEAIDALVVRAEGTRMGLLEAQARRLRGVQAHRDDDLALSLDQFEALGARRYAARLRTELGGLRGDQAMMDQGASALESMGELEQLTRLRSRGG
jgi:hypothetical protein